MGNVIRVSGGSTSITRPYFFSNAAFISGLSRLYVSIVPSFNVTVARLLLISILDTFFGSLRTAGAVGGVGKPSTITGRTSADGATGLAIPSTITGRTSADGAT